MGNAAGKAVLAGGLMRDDAVHLHRRLKAGYFTLEALNALAGAFYFNYLFFYMQKHFQFNNRDNLLLTALYGLVYMFAAWSAGRLAKTHGYFFFLRLGFFIVFASMLAGALIPRELGYTRAAMYLELAVLVCWTLGMTATFPVLQALLSHHESPGESARTAGIYNIVWAVTAAAAFLVGGAILERFGGEVLFWLAAALHLTQLMLLGPLQKLSTIPAAAEPVPGEFVETAPSFNPRPIAKARTFLKLAWVANPFAYIAIFVIIPMIPKLSENLGLSTASAGLILSVWFWVRLVAFLLFWRWTGWHYHFGWLFGAFVALIVSFVAIFLCNHVWEIIIAQIIFGLSVGLIYYSSLFYSMDAGESKGKGGGIHEAAIGLGTMVGPLAGVAALFFSPTHPEAEVWDVGGLLLLGLLFFLGIQFRARR